jgi:hypothetical protein
VSLPETGPDRTGAGGSETERGTKYKQTRAWPQAAIAVEGRQPILAVRGDLMQSHLAINRADYGNKDQVISGISFN